jgi:hypothetical protein
MMLSAAWRSVAVAILGVSCLLGVGCGSQGPEIKGTVKLDGAPLEGVRVSFQPLDPKAETTGAIAETDASGVFKIMPQADGVTLKPGKYGVTFSRMVDAQGKLPPARDRLMLEMSRQLTETIPSKYATQSAPRGNAPPVEIREIKNEPTDLTFDLKSK